MKTILPLVSLLICSLSAFSHADAISYLQPAWMPHMVIVAAAQTPTVPINQTPVAIPINISAYYDLSAGKGQPKILGALTTNVAYTTLPNGYFFCINPLLGASFDHAAQLVGGASLAIGTTIGNLLHNSKYNGLTLAIDAGLASYAGSKPHDIAGVSLTGTLKF